MDKHSNEWCQPAPRRLREATGDPSLSSLEDSLARWVEGVSLLEAAADSTPRDGQAVPDACLGHVVTNLCFPHAWPSPAVAHLATPRVHLAIGCHPKTAHQLTPAALGRLEELVRGRAVVAVGECGLDFSASCTVDRGVQEAALRAQVNLAIKYNLALVLHARGAERECFQILRLVTVGALLYPSSLPPPGPWTCPPSTLSTSTASTARRR